MVSSRAGVFSGAGRLPGASLHPRDGAQGARREVFTERAGLLGLRCGLGWRVGTWRRHVLSPVLMACCVSVLQWSFSAHRAVGRPGS